MLPHSIQPFKTGNRRIHVCHVISADLWAGAEVQVATTAAYLVHQPNITLSAVLFNDGPLADRLQDLNLPVAVIDEKQNNAWQLTSALAKFLKGRHVDILHTHRYSDTVVGSVAAMLAGVPRLVRTVHGLAEPLTGWNRLKYGAYEQLERMALRHRADAVVAVSGHIARAVERRGIDPARIVEIHNGIDSKQVVATRSRDDVRKELRIGPQQFVVGTAGRLTPVKAHAALLRAASRILRELPETIVLIVGDGPLDDELRESARQLRIANACRFTGARSDVYDLIAAMDVFALPSLSEGTPMALLEAMALRVPAVATAVGGIPEIIQHDVTGLLVPPGDDDALAYACLALARDEVKARRLALKARFLVEDDFSLTRSGDSLMTTYTRLAGDSIESASEPEMRDTGFQRAARALRSLPLRFRHAFERFRHARVRPDERSRLTAALRSAERLLIVCHGNIIRSAFASRLLARELAPEASITIDSAGLEAITGRQAHPHALTTALCHRVNLDDHRASRLDADRVAWADVIFVMDVPQLITMRRRFPAAAGKTFLLASFVDDRPDEIADPVLGDERVFRQSFDHIQRAIAPIAQLLSRSSSQP